MKNLKPVFAMTLALALAPVLTEADVRLPSVFSDHMVLQKMDKVPVWGQAQPGETVVVSVAGKKASTKAGTNGQWKVTLNLARSAPGPHVAVVQGNNRIEIQDVLVGEVWICSGQSNMQWPLSLAQNAGPEMAAATYPQIRLFTVPNVTAMTPQADCPGQWVACSPETAGSFSAVGYFFGRNLHQALGRPVGLINTSWGGTAAEAWTSASALMANLPEFKVALEALKHPSEADQLAATNYQLKVEARQLALQSLYALEDDLAGAGKTAATTFDDQAWATMKLPANWETQGLTNLDGVVWFRKMIVVPEAWAGKEIVLRLGPVDEVDNTWFNGTLVGGKGRSRTGDTSSWNIPRLYRVPGTLVKAGANTIAIRVFDCLGAGGLWGETSEVMYAECGDGSDATHIPLAGDWRYFVAFTLPVLPPNPAQSQAAQASLIFNAMIHPLIPYGIRGAIWYQGESNAGLPLQYRKLLPTLITDWRTRWGEGDFTFLIVQLANFMARNPAPEASLWAELREAQALTTAALPKVGLAVAIDIGDGADIHPRNKQDVALRLSLAARGIAYKEKLPYQGPTFKAMTVKEGKAILTFKNVDGGLMAKGESLKGFAVCGKDKLFVWAQAKIDGGKVTVWSETVPEPVAVRYAWANNPECNLYNAANLPAVPFRTDSE